MNQRAADRGSVTAEIAVALPVLVLVTVLALWGVSAAATQVACTDAVRSGARAAARGESPAAVRALVARAVPTGASISVRRDAVTTRVDVSTPIRAPAVTGLPPLTVHASAVAATEPGAAQPVGEAWTGMPPTGR